MGRFIGPRVVTDGLLLYLDAANPKSYPGSGSTWYDLTNNKNNGSINEPTFNSLNYGGFVFNGIDDVIDIPAINLVGDLTISQVIKVSDLNQGPMPIGGGNAAGGTTYWGYIWFRDFGGISFTVNGESGSVFNVSPTKWINKLIYYTVVRNSNMAYIYINGILEDSMGMVTDDFTIRTVGNSYDSFYTCDGTIYSTKIYNRALSADEITQNYNAIRSRFSL